MGCFLPTAKRQLWEERLLPNDRAGLGRARRKGRRQPGDRHLEMWGSWLVSPTPFGCALSHSACLSTPAQEVSCPRIISGPAPPSKGLPLFHPLLTHTLPIFAGVCRLGHISAHPPYIWDISHITNPALSSEKLENISRPLCLELYLTRPHENWV